MDDATLRHFLLLTIATYVSWRTIEGAAKLIVKANEDVTQEQMSRVLEKIRKTYNHTNYNR